jgi:HAD-superfamily hydrolase, subfamily IIB
MGKYKIAFFDIDGTLVSNNTDRSLPILERIPDSAKLAIKKLKENNVMPIISTGRGVAIIGEIMKGLEFAGCVASNGSIIQYQGEEIFAAPLHPAKIEEVISVIEQDPEIIWCYDSAIGRVVVAHKNIKISRYQQNLPVAQRNDYLKYPVYQIDIWSPLGLRNYPIPVADVQIKVVAPETINIFSANVSKGTAIEFLLAKLGIEKSEALAFGDEENDFEMFDAVGMPIAMGNAIPQLQAKASFVTDDVDNDGIFNACKQLGIF